MSQNPIEKFVQVMKKVWGPLNSETVAWGRKNLETLAQNVALSPEILSRLNDSPDGVEFYRDEETGFVLIGYVENEGLYRAPNDHGSAWVLYTVVSGEIEMGTYARHFHPQGELVLIQRDVSRMKPFECKAFLPGDIHDTRCTSKKVIVLRFTSRDLK